jgi:AcrR family transcriptional regulator
MIKRPLRVVGSGHRPDASVSPKRQTKLDAILDVGSEMFNQNGVGSVSLGEVASRAQMSRATLYYYVADREDLLFKCYLRACDAETETLAIANDADTGLDKLLRYLRLALDPRSRNIIITDIAFLSEGPREIIAKAQRRNHSTLCEIVSGGIADRSIRRCDEEIIARAITGIVNWSPIVDRWYESDASDGLGLDLDMACDFLAEGTSSNPAASPRCDLDVATFNRLQAASFDRKSRSDMRIEQIAMAASKLFNERGVEGVTLDDVSSSLGATRGAVYHYFQDKAELVRVCQARAVDLYEGFFDAAEAAGQNGAERAAFVTHLNTQAQAGPLAPLAPWVGLELLSAAQRQRQRRRIRSLFDRTVALAEEGIRDGSRRSHDVQSVARLRSGAYFWIPRWLSSREGYTPRRIADEITELFHKGLRAR